MDWDEFCLLVRLGDARDGLPMPKNGTREAIATWDREMVTFAKRLVDTCAGHNLRSTALFWCDDARKVGSRTSRMARWYLLACEFAGFEPKLWYCSPAVRYWHEARISDSYLNGRHGREYPNLIGVISGYTLSRIEKQQRARIGGFIDESITKPLGRVVSFTITDDDL